MIGVHGNKLVAARNNQKLPHEDKIILDEAIEQYYAWLKKIESIEPVGIHDCISQMVGLLNDYKLYLDVNVIFDDRNNFLYRQKGQLKLDNTVLEEFLPLLVKKTLTFANIDINDLEISSQAEVFSSAYFTSSLTSPRIGGGLTFKTKDQDFSISRKVFIKSSYSQRYEENQTASTSTNIGYIMAELKTNLDKTMFQEACATAHDVKLAVASAKYFLLCDFLDMEPIDTSITDIDQVVILRKAKRIGSNTRSNFNTYEGRQKYREYYVNFLKENPYNVEMFEYFMSFIIDRFSPNTVSEAAVLQTGHF